MSESNSSSDDDFFEFNKELHGEKFNKQEKQVEKQLNSQNERNKQLTKKRKILQKDHIFTANDLESYDIPTITEDIFNEEYQKKKASLKRKNDSEISIIDVDCLDVCCTISKEENKQNDNEYTKKINTTSKRYSFENSSILLEEDSKWERNINLNENVMSDELGNEVRNTQNVFEIMNFDYRNNKEENGFQEKENDYDYENPSISNIIEENEEGINKEIKGYVLKHTNNSSNNNLIQMSEENELRTKQINRITISDDSSEKIFFRIRKIKIRIMKRKRKQRNFNQ